MDVADDSAGRVAIFSVDATVDAGYRAPRMPDPAKARDPNMFLAVVADDPLGALIVAVTLVIALIAGLAFTH
jgi:hypothetical protein